MALKGTLKDFGIADILQLIAQQQKTGTLIVTNKKDEVRVGFRDGSIVKTESTTRRKKELIGEMLVRAELISEQALTDALEQQRRTLTRLGDVLVQQGEISAEGFRKMVQLQGTETLYRLFQWKTGAYEFEPGDVEVDSEGMSPLRADGVLLEGFRILDEWPSVRKTLPNDELTFAHAEPLPPPKEKKEIVPEEDDAFDEAFGGMGGGSRSAFDAVGDSERRVHGLVADGRPLWKIVELSCLGNFETCKALANLVRLGHLTVKTPKGKAVKVSRTPAPIGAAEGLSRVVAQVALSIVVLAAIGLMFLTVGEGVPGIGATPASSFSDPAAQRLVTASQLSRIRAAIDLYRLESGGLPEDLDTLVSSGLLTQGDLRYPWREVYFYRRSSPTAFVLLPPLR